MNEKKITSIEQFPETFIDIGAEAAKTMEPSYRYRYRVNISYTTDDGSVYTSRITSKTRKGISEEFARLSEKISNGRCAALLHDDGSFWGIRATY
jgi:hypothetical protein